jgi:hypothetical protein
MQESEVPELTRTLKSMQSKGPDGGPSSPGLSINRVGVLLGDVLGALADIHAQEMARELGRANLAPPTRKWMEGAFRSMQQCGPQRFEGRGGMAAYRQTLGLVQKYRTTLEPLVLETTRLFPIGKPRPAGGRQ